MYCNVWQQWKDASGRKLNEASSSFCAQQASPNIWTGAQLGFVHPKCEKCPFLLLLRLTGTFPDDIILSRTLPYCPPQPHIEVLLLQRAISISGWLAAPTACHRIKAYHSSNLHFTSPSLHSPYKYLPFLPSSPSSLSSSSPLFPICYYIQIFSKVISSSWVICPMFKVISRRCSQQKILDGDLFGHTGMLTPYERSETIFSDPQLTSYPDKNGNKSSHSQNYRD